MKSINVEGLPEPVAQALQHVVKALRQELQSQQPQKRQKVDLPVWEGTVKGKLTREEIYEDVG